MPENLMLFCEKKNSRFAHAFKNYDTWLEKAREAGAQTNFHRKEGTCENLKGSLARNKHIAVCKSRTFDQMFVS